MIEIDTGTLFFWQVTCELPSGTKVECSGISEKSRTTAILAQKQVSMFWHCEPQEIEVLDLKRVGRVNFGAY